MKVIGINGSPRKNCNTATMVKKALDGAQSKGAKTELIHLYDLDYKGCKSCFACKLKDGKSYGICAAALSEQTLPELAPQALQFTLQPFHELLLQIFPEFVEFSSN